VGLGTVREARESVVGEAFLESARRTYGDLSAPDFGLINDTIERRPYASMVRKFADFCTIDDDQHNSWHDDVGLCVVLSREKQSCVVWMSYVGPYAVVHLGLPAVRNVLRDDDFVYAGSPAPEWLAQVRSVLESAGFWVMPPWLLREKMDFYSVNDAAVQSMPMVRVFFTDLEDLFPFEA
jgi:hypothetical protein